MSHKEILRLEKVQPELLAEASVWIARLHGPNRTPAMENGFRRWLATSSAHARGFEIATEAWDDSRNLARVVQWESNVPKAIRLRSVAAMAAVAMIAVLGAIFYFGFAGVSTNRGEQRQLTLEDGTRIFLNTATHIVVHYNDKERRVQLSEGEALFEVAKRPEWPFLVEVGDHQVRALGTSFVIRRDDQRTSVTLIEGKVSVAPTPLKVARSGTPTTGQTLTPGERLTFKTFAPPIIDRPVLNVVIAWRRGQVVLDDTPLSEAVHEMNRYSFVSLAIAHPETANLRVSGLFQAGDSESFATAVAQTYGLEVVKDPKQILLVGTSSDPTIGNEGGRQN